MKKILYAIAIALPWMFLYRYPVGAIAVNVFLCLLIVRYAPDFNDKIIR